MRHHFIFMLALSLLFSVPNAQQAVAQATFKPAANDKLAEKDKKPPRKSPGEDTAKPRADRVSNPIAVFDGLDKITARVTSFETNIAKTVQFGALKVTPRVCNTRAYSDNPRTSAFVEVDEIDLNGETKRIFTGWMFADSPGLNAVEHPVFDVWLKSCKGGKQGEIKEGPKTGYDGDGPQLEDENAASQSDLKPSIPAQKPKSQR